MIMLCGHFATQLALGKRAAFDISVTSPLIPKFISVAEAAALSTEVRKHSENEPKCCIPLVTESYGVWGKPYNMRQNKVSYAF